MTTPTTDRRLGLNGGAAIKVPCRAATTANITLSGEQTVDGVACVTGDRVLVKNQTDQTTNGVYDVSTAAWTRSYDYNGNFDVVRGTVVGIIEGTTNANTYWRLTTTGTITIGTSNLTYSSALLSTSSDLVSFIQSGTGAVARLVQDKLREKISVFDFMTAAQIADVQANTALVDVTTAVQAAATAATGKKLYMPKGTYLISTKITVPTGTTVYGDGDATIIKLANGTIDGFYTSGATATIIRDLKILGVTVSATGYIGGVQFYNSTACHAVNLTMVGMVWSGVLLWDSSKCHVTRCRMSGWLGTGGDTHDISAYGNSNDNYIYNNHCAGGGYHGIIVFDPYLSATPTGNTIIGNHVYEHTAYGILLYVTTQFDTKTIVTNNHVQDITGTAGVGAFGAGIHCQSAGGSIIAHNVITNCCRSTSNFETLGMAAITVAIGEYAGTASKQVIVAHNQIQAQRGPAIYALASDNAVVIDGNVIKSTGTTAVRGEAIIVNNAKRAKVVNNDVQHANTNYYAIRVTADTTEYSNHIVDNNTVIGTGAGGLIVNFIGTGFAQKIKVSGNDIELTGGGTAYFMQKSNRLRFIGNQAKTDGIALYVDRCELARYSTNQLQSSLLTAGIIFTGTNTGSVFDASNNVEVAYIDNQSGNGTIVSLYGTAAPTTGNACVGDERINSVPSIGAPERWKCTTAGGPGTWIPVGIISGVSADVGDAAVTLTAGTSSPTCRYATPITADRAVTLSTTGVWNGAKFRIVRTAAATGAFNVNVGTGPLKALAAAGTWCDVEYNGSAWMLVAYGAL